MKLLFIHQNFPGQFKHLAPALQAAGHDVRALTLQGVGLSTVPMLRYSLRRGTSPGVHPWVGDFETKVIRGEAVLAALHAMNQRGWVPDVVVAHPGWGESLFVKDIWPNAKLLHFIEFYYGAEGRDTGFDPEFSNDGLTARARLRLKNANHLLSLESMDWGLAPTHWQKSTIPAPWQDKVSVIFDGIDTAVVKPNPQATLRLYADTGRELSLQAGQPILTFVARELEPYRGYHRFMRALPEIQARCPQAVILIVGGDGVAYGSAAPEGKSWRSIFLDEVQSQLDLSKVHFLGKLPYDQYLKVLQISTCHVYLTYPFVLSWSCVEALAAGCLVLGSRTAPVQEVITHEHSGLLVDFFDSHELAEKAVDALRYPSKYMHIRKAARQLAVESFSLEHCLPRQMALINEIMTH